MKLTGRMFYFKSIQGTGLDDLLLLCLDDNPRCLTLALNCFTSTIRSLDSITWFKSVFMDLDKHIEDGTIEEVLLEDLPLFISMKHRSPNFIRLLSGAITIDWLISRYVPYFDIKRSMIL